jgi:hypothetical protein
MAAQRSTEFNRDVQCPDRFVHKETRRVSDVFLVIRYKIQHPR